MFSKTGNRKPGHDNVQPDEIHGDEKRETGNEKREINFEISESESQGIPESRNPESHSRKQIGTGKK